MASNMMAERYQRDFAMAHIGKRAASIDIVIEQAEPKKRIARACLSCRVKRVKCDGQEPQCSTCRNRRESCEYSQENNRKRASNAYVSALEARVEVLEKLLALRPDPHKQLIIPEEEESVQISSIQGHLYQSHMPCKGGSTPEEGTDIDEMVEALGCFTIGDTGELRFFGGASNFSLVRDHSFKISSSMDARKNGMKAAQALPTYFTPTDEIRDELLELFWKWQNTWQFIVAREPFVMDLYVHKSGKYCTPLLLNSVLALASRFSRRPEIRTNPTDPATTGELFAVQARAMLNHEFEAPTTSTVQAAGLLGLYLATGDQEGLGFVYVGMGSRMAMNLGLQHDCSSFYRKGLLSKEELQCRSTAFWGIFFLDKLFCLGMGRPAGIQEYNITTPRPIAEDPVVDLPPHLMRISSPWSTKHITENFQQLIEIFFITSGVLDLLYSQKPNWSDQERDDRVMMTHLNLAKWFETLPKNLKISESSRQPSAPYIYQLHIQYYQATILMHRPFLKELYHGRGTSAYDPIRGDIHCKACHTAAVKMANILRIFQLNYGHNCMPVSAVHPAFTAAIIHMLDIKVGPPNIQKPAARHLKACIKTLYEMNMNWDWSNRALRATHSLAIQWKIEPWLRETMNDIDMVNIQRYEKYLQSCQGRVELPGFEHEVNDSVPAVPFEDFFDAMNADALLDGIFEFSHSLSEFEAAAAMYGMENTQLRIGIEASI